jgi:hypothetical protein
VVDEPTVNGVRDADPRTPVERLNGWLAGLPQRAPEQPSPVDEQPMFYRLLQKAQIGGVIRRQGEMVSVLPSQAGPHMELIPGQEDDDMNEEQFNRCMTRMEQLFQPINEFVARQASLNQQTAQTELTTRALIGNDAARSAGAEVGPNAEHATALGAPITPENDMGTLPPPEHVDPAPLPEKTPPEAEQPPVGDMGPQSNAPGETMLESSSVATKDGRIVELGEEAPPPSDLGEH